MAGITTIDDIPAEVLATAFEIGILSTGIRFLPPVCLVCRAWYNVATETPRLWGIIDMSLYSDPQLLLDQVARAKAAPLTVFLSPGVSKKPTVSKVINQLLELSHNWVSAALPSRVFARRAWPESYPNLEVLELTAASKGKGAKPLEPENARFGPSTRLRTLLIKSLDNNWVQPFLSPSITSFSYTHATPGITVAETLNQLSRIPNVQTLKLGKMHHHPALPSSTSVVELHRLVNLELEEVRYPSLLLSCLVAPQVQTLTIDRTQTHSWHRYGTQGWMQAHTQHDPAIRTLTPFLVQWCEPRFIPSNLHTLTLVDCLVETDIPFLIRFLARVPHLIRLKLVTECLRMEDPKLDLLNALVDPHVDDGSSGGGGYLCPSLMILHLEAEDVQIGELIPIGIVRGIHSTVPPSSSNESIIPRRLRKIVGGFLCEDETQMQSLGQLVESIECTCLGCNMATLTLLH